MIFIKDEKALFCIPSGRLKLVSEPRLTAMLYRRSKGSWV